MTYSIGSAGRGPFDAGGVRYGLAAMCLLLLAGCANGDVGKNAAVASGPGIVGPQDTGAYPNLNVPPEQAAPQFTEADKNAKLSALAADRAAATRGRASPDPKDAAELAELARNHGKNTLKAIGATCDPALDPNCK